jgi:hemerythrin-like domain-containing protein
MNTATKNLENDHVNILRLIDVMEKMANTSSSSITDLETVVNLIKSYADGFHHAKEENLLFPLMVNKGFSLEQGPVAVMLHEHTQGRNYVKGMTDGIASFKEGNKPELAKIYENFQGYIVLLRSHISKENNVLFRMADKAFTEIEQQELLKNFAKVEQSNFCGGVLKDCIGAIDQLETNYFH